MIFALTNKYQVFNPLNPKSALFHAQFYGPSWEGALALYGPIMNEEDRGSCKTSDNYIVPGDKDERSPLTGSSRAVNRYTERFTCVELEVYALK